MAAIRGKDTKPELAVRALLRANGYVGYRLHRKDLPGRPDIAFIGRKKAIFVHGCFWHGHGCRAGRRRPRSNLDYWGPKISGNRERDERYLFEYRKLGWEVLIVWECEVRDHALAARMSAFLGEQITLTPSPAAHHCCGH